MCGISGYIARTQEISGRRFYEAHNLMANRGPDDEGFAVIDSNGCTQAYGDRSIDSAKYGLKYINSIEKVQTIIGHVRLSIIDLTDTGHQPMVDSIQKIVLSFNGEIYNYLELKSDLEKEGYCFSTKSDTEVVLKAYACWGYECFNKFNGMWAIALYDYEKQKLVLSRDRFGVKPLFYSVTDEALVFASVLKVVYKLIGGSSFSTINIEKYLKSSIICDDESTLFNEISEVQPGYIYEFGKDGCLKKFRYWTFQPSLIILSEEDALDKFTELFRDSIRLRMRSDVEVGSLLSGGLDSTVIAGTLKDEGIIPSQYKTFSSVYEDERYSEKKYIDDTVEQIGIRSDLLYMDAKMVAATIDKALFQSEMPLRAVPMILQYLLYQRISESSNVKVVLNGQGADELFGGYNADYMTRFIQLIYTNRWSELFKEIKKYMRERNIGVKQILGGIYGQSKIEHNTKNNVYNEIAFHQVTHTPLREYLMYDDRAAMSFGIENRAPFLDYRLVEFAFSLDSDLKINKHSNKAIVRRYAKEIIPDTVLNRKDKMGFTSPQETWQKKEWKSMFDAEFEVIKQHGLFGLDSVILNEEYKQYQNNGSVDWAYIWRIFCLSRWKKVVSAWGV